MCANLLQGGASFLVWLIELLKHFKSNDLEVAWVHGLPACLLEFAVALIDVLLPLVPDIIELLLEDSLFALCLFKLCLSKG